MIYADTNFFVALAKDDDWLQQRAVSVAKENRGEIYTSRATLLELLVISDRFEFDRMEALAYALEIAEIAESEEELFQAAELMDEFGMTAFDAFHAAYAESDPIVTSDKRFDEIPDTTRIELESGAENGNSG